MRARKQFAPRVNPLWQFSGKKFRQRYHLDKATVLRLARDFANSRFCFTRCGGQGGGVPISERVS